MATPTDRSGLSHHAGVDIIIIDIFVLQRPSGETLSSGLLNCTRSSRAEHTKNTQEDTGKHK